MKIETSHMQLNAIKAEETTKDQTDGLDDQNSLRIFYASLVITSAQVYIVFVKQRLYFLATSPRRTVLRRNQR